MAHPRERIERARAAPDREEGWLDRKGGSLRRSSVEAAEDDNEIRREVHRSADPT